MTKSLKKKMLPVAVASALAIMSMTAMAANSDTVGTQSYDGTSDNNKSIGSTWSYVDFNAASGGSISNYNPTYNFINSNNNNNIGDFNQFRNSDFNTVFGNLNSLSEASHNTVYGNLNKFHYVTNSLIYGERNQVYGETNPVDGDIIVTNNVAMGKDNTIYNSNNSFVAGVRIVAMGNTGTMGGSANIGDKKVGTGVNIGLISNVAGVQQVANGSDIFMTAGGSAGNNGTFVASGSALMNNYESGIDKAYLFGTNQHTSLNNLSNIGGFGDNLTFTNSNQLIFGFNLTNTRANNMMIGNGATAYTISNVANGTQTNDAVNLGQLNAVQSSLNTSVTNIDGRVTTLESTVAGLGGGGGGGSLSSTDGGTVNASVSSGSGVNTMIAGDGTNGSAITNAVYGTNLYATDGTTTSIIYVTPNSNAIATYGTLGTATTMTNDLGVKSLVTGDNQSITQVYNDGNATHSAGTVVQKGDVQIYAGSGAATSTINVNADTGITLNAGSGKTTSIVAGSSAVTFSGTGVDMGGNRIQNVGKAVAGTDAMNLQSTQDLINSTAATKAELNGLRNQIDKNHRMALNGIAMAMANANPVIEPGKNEAMAMSAATFGGQVGVGVRYAFKAGAATVSAGVMFSGAGDVGASVSYSFPTSFLQGKDSSVK